MKLERKLIKLKNILRSNSTWNQKFRKELLEFTLNHPHWDEALAVQEASSYSSKNLPLVPTPGRAFLFKFGLALAAVVLLVLLPVSAIYAQNSTPGQTLYPVKRLTEEIQITLTFNEQSKSTLKQEFALRRVEELAQTLQKGSQKQQEMAIVEVQKTITEIIYNLPEDFKKDSLSQIEEKLDQIKSDEIPPHLNEGFGKINEILQSGKLFFDLKQANPSQSSLSAQLNFQNQSDHANQEQNDPEEKIPNLESELTPNTPSTQSDSESEPTPTTSYGVLEFSSNNSNPSSDKGKEGAPKTEEPQFLPTTTPTPNPPPPPSEPIPSTNSFITPTLPLLPTDKPSPPARVTKHYSFNKDKNKNGENNPSRKNPTEDITPPKKVELTPTLSNVEYSTSPEEDGKFPDLPSPQSPTTTPTPQEQETPPIPAKESGDRKLSQRSNYREDAVNDKNTQPRNRMELKDIWGKVRKLLFHHLPPT